MPDEPQAPDPLEPQPLAEGPRFYVLVGLAFIAVFGLLAAFVGNWKTAFGLLCVGLALGVTFLLLRRGRQYAALHCFAGALFTYQCANLYVYQGTPSVGIIWFLVLPAILASFGRQIDVLVWIPISAAGVLFAYGFVQDDPAFAHPLSLPNLLGALTFLAVVCTRFLVDRDGREAALKQAVERAESEVERRRQAEDEARAAEQQTTRFLASMSHELRSPMTSMLLSSELLKRDGKVSQEQAQQAAQRIQDSAQVVLNLVNDVLDLAKIDAGKTESQPRTFPLESLLEDVRLLLNPAAEAGGTRLYVLFGPDLPAQWVSDPACVRQILINLVSNAIKHSPRGAVVLQARTSNRRLLFEVTDTGAGIDAADAERIFDPFVQLAQATEQGTGLGLTLCRQYAALIDGQLTLQSSTPGKGSRFRLRLPAPANPDPDAGTVGAAYASDRLAGLSYRVQSTRPEAVAWAESWLRFWGAELNELGTPCDLEATLPAAIGSVADLALHLGALTGSPIGELKVEETGGVRGRCLICDDNEMIRDVLTSVLESLGYAATAVAGSDELWRALQETRFDMLFLDVQLNGESGVDVLRALRDRGEAWHRLPVCMISGSLMGREEALAAGANEYLLKPPRLREVAEVAASLVAQSA